MKPNKTPRKHAAFASSRRQKRKWMTAVACMAVLVAFGTIWALMMPAATLEGEAHCGLTEHTHNESCYESVLVCGQEEGSGHVHDDSCYETVLTCEIPEHTHTDECYAQTETGNETGTGAVKEDGTGAGAGTETGTGSDSTGSNNGTGTGTEAGAGDTGNAGTDAGTGTGNAGTGSAGNNGSAGTGEAGGQDGTSGTGNTGSGTGAEDKAETGSGTEEAGGQDDTLKEEEKTEDAQNSQAAEKAADMPNGAEIPEGYTEQYTVRDDENGFAVTVYAPEGVVPEGAVLSAALLEENDDAYAKAEQELAEETEKALAENGIDLQSEDGETAEPSYGFAALDIHFEDADGNEVEPNGQVYVVIDAAGLIPEDADPDSVTVQHHAEQEDAQVAVETVADTTDSTDTGVVTVVENAEQDKNDVQAAFEVDGFSTFTITWSSGGLFDTTYFQVTVHYVDENGEGIQGTQVEDIGISNNDEIEFANYAGAIEGYTFSDSHYKNYNGPTVARMESSSETEDSGFIQITTRSLKFYNSSNRLVDTLTYTDFEDWSPERANIYLVYQKNENPGGGTVTENATVTTSKTAVLREDGNYDLTLSISGDRGTNSQKQPVDVLFILDESGSMDYKLNRDEDAGRYEYSRMDLLKSSVESLVNTVAGNTSIDARFAAVSFARSQQRDQAGWTTADGVISFVDELDPDGGTNYQQGIYDGKELLKSARSDALTFVIFVSDGEPTYRGINVTNSSGSSDSRPSDHGNGQDDDNGYNIAAAVNEIGSMNCNYFYAIGMGPEFGTDWWGDDLQGTENLKSLAKAVNATTSKGDNNVFNANNTDALKEAFDKITSSITFFAAQNVTITDPLSEYADLVLTNGAPQFTISITNGGQTWSGTVANNGTVTFYDAEGNAQTATARVSSDNRTIYLDLPDTYELEEDYTYSISTIIAPSQAAIDAGMNSDDAKQAPDKGTGTHADNGEKGFWSNDNENAKVTYTANGEDGSENFPRPVIQVQEPETGDLTITKEVSGATVENQRYTFTISTQIADVAGQTYATSNGDTEVTFSQDDNGLYTASISLSATTVDNGVDGSITIYDLPLGNYTVTENTDNVAITGFRFDGETYVVGETTSDDCGNVSLTTESTDATVAVTNKYTQVVDVTIHKVDENNKDLLGAEFQLTNAEGQYYSHNAETRIVSWNVSQTLLPADTADTSMFHIYGLENGVYTLTETKAPDGYQLLTSSITITVHNGEVSISNVAGVSIDKSGNTITIANATGTELPETGGPGTTILAIGGLLLMAGAVGGGYGLRRRRGKEGR